MQQSKAAKVDGSSSTQKSTLLQQLGLVVAVSDGDRPPSEGSAGEEKEKADSQAEGEKQEEVEVEGGADPFLPAERPQQKNKKKCWICKSKLELAQRELGTCKCGKFFFDELGCALFDMLCFFVVCSVFIVLVRTWYVCKVSSFKC